MTKSGTSKTKATPGGGVKAGTGDAPVLEFATPEQPRPPEFGEAVPTFTAVALNGNPTYAFNSAAGRPILMLLVGSSAWQPGSEALALLGRNAHVFDDDHASFFGVTVDPNDVAKGRIAQRLPGIRWFLDYDMAVSRRFSAVRGVDRGAHYFPYWLALDPTMRVVARAPIAEGESIFRILDAMIAKGAEQNNAPVLTVPRVFEPELCRELIRLYQNYGGKDSGFMRMQDGKTVAVLDHGFKRRSDYHITDQALQTALLDRIRRRLIPQIERVFNYQPTRIERWVVACYDSAGGGFFRPHRDNTTAGTAHRAFACTINLNAEEYDGGELRFPEYGPRTYRAPTGGAVVFSCSLLHEATPVTLGKRYALLPFFYDERNARLREANQVYFENGAGNYRADLARPPTKPPV